MISFAWGAWNGPGAASVATSCPMAAPVLWGTDRDPLHALHLLPEWPTVAEGMRRQSASSSWEFSSGPMVFDCQPPTAIGWGSLKGIVSSVA